MIDPKSQGGLRLKNWRNPVYSHNSQTVGDFPRVVYDEVRLRSNVMVSTQTVKQTHDLLNQLSKSSGNIDKQVDAFKSMCMNYTAKEVMWLIRIIIKALHIGMTENSILDTYHPHAKHALDCGKDLRYIASEELKDISTISLFSPLIPQRGLKGTPSSLKNFVKQTNNHFYIEEKIDGERLQLHYDKELDQIKWFTRNQIEETGRYGNRSTASTKLSSKVIPGLNGKTLILDGEMVAYDPNSDTFLPFGTLKTAAANDINDDDQPHPCFIVFDVLWYNDHLIMNYKLEDRLKVLDKVVTNQGKHMFILPRIIGSSEDQVQDELASMIIKRKEGLILKNPNLVYNLNSKNGAWLKMKPEYMDGMTENSDLIVVGAKYGTGRRSNKMAQFLVAVRDDRIPDTEDPKFITYAMIGIGFKDDDLKELSQTITSTVPYNRNNQPEWLGHPKRSNEEPDVIIDYRQSLVFEIKATQIVTASHVGMTHSLRFPRFVRVRKDKSWKDCMTVKDVEEALSEGRVGQKRVSPNALVVQGPKKKSRTSYTLLASQIGFDSRTAEKKTDLFDGLTFCILSGNDQYTKEALEKMVTENGGGYLQSPAKATFVVAGVRVFRVKSLISKGTFSLIYPQYIVDCIDEQTIVELSPNTQE
ncbi:DNA ligase/mRNA capping enzyme [Backusella circina FSU 941]|nr:DNA ligase/mRNA capping enzyme [Backusella circina FSU 941]